MSKDRDLMNIAKEKAAKEKRGRKPVSKKVEKKLKDNSVTKKVNISLGGDELSHLEKLEDAIGRRLPTTQLVRIACRVADLKNKDLEAISDEISGLYKTGPRG